MTDQLRLEDHRSRCCEKSKGDQLVCNECAEISAAYSAAMGRDEPSKSGITAAHVECVLEEWFGGSYFYFATKEARNNWRVDMLAALTKAFSNDNPHTVNPRAAAG